VKISMRAAHLTIVIVTVATAVFVAIVLSGCVPTAATPAPTASVAVFDRQPTECDLWVALLTDSSPSVCDGYDGSFLACGQRGVMESRSACVMSREALCVGVDDCPVTGDYVFVYDWRAFMDDWRAGATEFPTCATEDGVLCVFDSETRGNGQYVTRGRFLLSFTHD